MFETLETTLSEDEAVEAVRALLFEDRVPPETLATSLEAVEGRFVPVDLLDNAARRELPHIYHRSGSNGYGFPEVLESWKGDFREGTDEIFEMVQSGEYPSEVESYQQSMRSELPRVIPLVRGVEGGESEYGLTSWSSKIGTADLYGSTILYTEASPEDVFMCSMYGDEIGEQEFVLTEYTVQDRFDTTIEDYVEIYQRMDSVL